MNKLKEISYYLKYISFIFFLYSAIIIYPGLITQKIGICLLILIIIYSVVTFFMFLAQKKGEHYADNYQHHFTFKLSEIGALYVCEVQQAYRIGKR